MPNAETLTLFPMGDLTLLAPQKLETKLMLIPRRRLKDAVEEIGHPKRNDLRHIPISRFLNQKARSLPVTTCAVPVIENHCMFMHSFQLAF